MSWRDDMLEASFRGVPFFVQDHERVSGRRVIASELPFRDAPSTEDLGRGVRKFEITGYVLDEDYFGNRDMLIAACEDSGDVGTLVHPYLGELRVRCQTLRVVERQDKGRIATFNLGFIEAGEDPVAAVSTRSSWLRTAKNLLRIARRVFNAVNTLRNMPPNVLLGFLGEIVVDRVGVWAGIGHVSLSEVRNEVTAAIAAFSTPPTLDAVAARTVAPFDAMSAAVLQAPRPLPSASDAARTVGGLAGTSRGDEADPVRIAGLVLLGYQLPGGSAAYPLQESIRALARCAELVACAQILTEAQWPNAAAAEAARVNLLGAVDHEAEVAADAGQDELYSAWRAFGTAAAIDLAERAKQAPRLVSYAVGAPIGSLVLAHRLYQDAGRADELVALGGAAHPGFLPATGPALAP